MFLAVFLLDEAEPITSHLYHILEFAVYLAYLALDGSYVLGSLVLVELEDASHLDVHQLEDIVLGDFANHLGIIRCKTLVNPFASGIHRLCLLEFLVLIDAFLNEYLLEIGKM